MPELGAFGSARGVPGNGHSYRKPRPISVIPRVDEPASNQVVGGSSQLTGISKNNLLPFLLTALWVST